jgi:hypothetical protein
VSFPVQLSYAGIGDSWVFDAPAADGHQREIAVVAGLGYVFITQTDFYEYHPAVSDPLDRSVYGIILADPTGTIFGGYRTDRATTLDVAADGSYELDKDRPNTTYHYHGTLRTGMPWVAAAAIGPSDKITIFYDTSPYPGTTVEVAVVAVQPILRPTWTRGSLGGTGCPNLTAAGS